MLKFIRLFLAGILILLLSGCGQNKMPYIDFNNNNATNVTLPAQKDDKLLKVAISSITSPSEAVSYYDELLKNLGQELGYKIKVIQKNSYFEVNDLLRTGQVDVAFICTYSYLAGKKQFGLELLAVPEINGKTSYQSFVIVRKDSGIDCFADLEGKIFAFTDPMSTTGYFYPQYLLISQNTTDKKFFKKTFFTYSHDNAIKAVAKGIADGAAVDSIVFLRMQNQNPKLTENLKIINQSPEYYTPPIVVRPGLPRNLKEKILKYFLTLHQKPKGQEILEKIGIDRFVYGNPTKYREIDVMTQKVNLYYGHR